MGRDEIEDLVYASLGRHLRVTCVLGLLFLGIGFVMGHLVAAQHSRVLSERWSARAEQLSKQVAQVEAKLKAELTKVREPAQTERSAPTVVPTSTTQGIDLTPPVIVTEASQEEELRKEAETHVARVEEQCREQVARCIAETEREKTRIQSELQPFLDRKMTIQATIVSGAVNRLLDTQMAHLKTLAHEDVPTVQAQDAPYFRSSAISPISAESSPPQTRPSLLPVPGDQASSSEDATLMPLPTAPMVSVPVAAEPTREQGAAMELGQPEAPNLPRRTIFIRSRKPVEVSNDAGAMVQ